MANLLKSLVRHTLFRKSGSLVCFDKNYAAIGRLLRGHRVTGMLDAGASNGRLSRRFLRMFPEAQVFAFEPQPLYRQTLERFAQEDTRFHPQFVALSDTVGTADLKVTQSPGTTSLFLPEQRMKTLYPKETVATGVEKVEVVTVDDWATHNGDPAVQLMKFDIQGGELKAMQGASRVLQTSTLLVYTEIFFNPLYEGGAIYSQIDLCLRESGFLLHNIFKPKSDRNDVLVQADAIFVHAERLGL
ncbi:MAG: FkbM family methyltransferase [Gammaproteobacteria bacterium]|jgi:FkbM family methyltransferase|nr:FkbM family methyltransferase [Gammaproteobacteria bacterium]